MKKRAIVIEAIERTPIEQQHIELVERKGLGHPDTICDAVCEAASRELSKYYLKKFGAILHHNLDKGLLVAGRAKPRFGGGRILEPIKLIIAGRATSQVGKKRIPVDAIAKKAAIDYLSRNLRLDRKYVKISTNIKPGAGSLQEVFKRAKLMPLANDTSIGVSFAPLSRTERLVLRASELINSKPFQKRFPAVGDDIKVMGTRIGKKTTLTVAIAFIDRYVHNIKEYFDIKEQVLRYLKKTLGIEIHLNTLDDPKAKKEDDVYLTVTGFSAEQGDDGQVGRGNKINGLITPSRLMNAECAAGKNPVAHVGKVYNVLAQLMAQDIAKLCGEVYIKILSEIGKPIDRPLVASIQLVNGVDSKTKAKILQIADRWLANVQKVTPLVIKEKVRLY